ncbi:MAG: hypothetical protein ABIL58_08150 [Pseudomonadota bacterium]
MPTPTATDKPNGPATQGPIELDQIDLPPEVLAAPDAPAPPPADGSTPKPRENDLADDAPAPPEPFPETIRTLFIAAAVITAAVWTVVGALYLMDWLKK